MPDAESRRRARLQRYDELRAERPDRFANPPGAAIEIVFDPVTQAEVADRSAARLRDLGRPEEYGDIGVIYEDPWYIAVRDAVRFRDGFTGPYVRLLSRHIQPGAVVLPRLPDGRVLLIREFRHATRGWQWGLPRGFAEPGDAGPATAIRELQEETGVTAASVELIGRIAHEGDGAEIYLARLDGEPPAAPSAHAVTEGVDELRVVTPAELAAMIAGGEITNEFVLAAYAIAAAKGLL